MSWSQVLQLDDPVVGDVEDYEFARDQVDKLGDAATIVRDQFKRIRTAELDELQGRAAIQLRELVRSVDDCLRDLPVVLHDVEQIFRNHAQELADLRRRAEQALATAETRWNTLQSALSAERAADSRLQYLRSQRQSLDYSSASPEHVSAQRAELSSRIQSQSSHLSSCRASATIARNKLNLSRGEHKQLQSEEQVLVRRTVQSLNGVDLQSLANPGWLESVGGWIGDRLQDLADWVEDFVGDIGKMVEAFSEGEFEDALHYFRDVLDKLSTAVFVIGIIACVIAAPFTSGTSLALLPVIFAASAGIDAVRFGVSTGLAAAGTPHPETGNPVTWGEVAFDAFLVGLSVVGGKATSKVAQKIVRGGRKGYYNTSISYTDKAKAFLGKRGVKRGVPHKGRLDIRYWHPKNADFTYPFRQHNTKGAHWATKRRARLDSKAWAIDDAFWWGMTKYAAPEIKTTVECILENNTSGPSVADFRGIYQLAER